MGITWEEADDSAKQIRMAPDGRSVAQCIHLNHGQGHSKTLPLTFAGAELPRMLAMRLRCDILPIIALYKYFY